MSLLLTVYSTPTWKAFAHVSGLPLITEVPFSMTETAALLIPEQPLSTLSTLVLGLPSGHSLWLAVEQAEYFLANAIENGKDLENAAKQWQEQTSVLLTLHSQHRRQLQLFNLQQALAQPITFRDKLNSAVPIAHYSAQTINNNLALLAACQYVAQQPELRSLNTRLQASALPLCESEILTPDINQILLQNNSIAAQLTATIKERDLILLHLQEVQEQLESRYQALVSLQAEEQKSKHATLARDKQQAREITKLEAELRKTKAWAASSEYASQLLQQELTELRGSTLWKMTQPVRALGSMVKKTDKAHDKLLQDTALLLTSEYFDIEWYLQSYPDVAESKMNPAEHYLLFGAPEGRLPGPLFDGNWYMQHYPDVGTAGVNPLLHFIMFGQQEGRSTSPILLTNNSQNVEE